MGDNFFSFIRKGIGLFMILFTLTSTHGQFYHGLEVGANFNNASFSTIDRSSDTDILSGFNFGYVAERDLSDNLYVRIAVLSNRRGLKTVMRRGQNISNEKWGLSVIEIPLNFGYYVNWNNRKLQFFVDAGLSIDFNISAYTENENEKITIDIGSDKDIKSISNGFNVGAGLLISSRVKVRLSYYNAFSSVFTVEPDQWKNKSYGISVNYFLKRKKPGPKIIK